MCIVDDEMNKVDVNKISKEEWLTLERMVPIQACQTFMNALLDQGGSESALNNIRPYMRLSGHAFSINMTRLFDIKGDDLDRIGDVCFLYERLFGYDMNEIERSSERLVRVGGIKCPWQGNPKEGCMAGHEMFFNAVCESINPEYECRFTQMITKGDPMCSYVIEKKKK